MNDSTGEIADERGNPEIEESLDRDIGLIGAIAIGVGTMIAAGIFVLSGLAVSNVGAAAIVSFLIAAIVASFTAFAYAEFASLYPESGGGYMYVANVFETDLTYIVGWSMILGYPASAAFYLASFSDWFFRFIYPALDIPQAIPYWVAGIAVLGLLVAVNLKGTEETGLFQIIITSLKIALILLFLYGGLQAFNGEVIVNSMSANITHFREIGVTSALVFITFFGFEAIATNAEEIEEPGRNVPRAIFISMGFVTVIYTLVVLVIVLAINNPDFLGFLADIADLPSPKAAEMFIAEHGEVAMGRVAQYYLGDIGFYVIIVGALLSMLSAANATILAGSRVKLAMARRNHLPAQFEDLHPSLNTPYKSVLLTGGLILFYIIVFSVVFGGTPGAEGVSPPFGIHLGVEAMAHFADFMLLGGLIFVNFAIIRSRRKEPDRERGFKVPAVPYVPIIAVLANFVLLANVEPTSLAIGIIAEIIGVIFWFTVMSGGTSVEEIERETPTVVAEHNPSQREYQIVVPIANPEHVEQLMRTADDLAAVNNGEVLVMSVVTVPEQTPLEEGRQFVDDKREVLNRAMDLAEEANVPVSGTVRIGHSVGDAILNTVDQYDSDAVLLGWGGKRSSRAEIVLGSTVDTIATEAQCDVLVEKIGNAGSVDSILLPTAGGVHAELSAETAQAIARSEDATVQVSHIVDPDASESERSDAQDLVAETVERFDDVDVKQEILEGSDIAQTIVDESGSHDITMIGATREGTLQQLVFGAIPETVGEAAPNTVIMTKRNEAITSRVRRWLDQI
jgi:APA family basic amino acid/polyamine antiporter